MMRITLDIDEKLLQRVIEATGETSKSRAISHALEEYVRRARIEDLLSLRGKLDLDLDDWHEFRNMER